MESSRSQAKVYEKEKLFPFWSFEINYFSHLVIDRMFVIDLMFFEINEIADSKINRQINLTF